MDELNPELQERLEELDRELEVCQLTPPGCSANSTMSMALDAWSSLDSHAIRSGLDMKAVCWDGSWLYLRGNP